MAPAEATATGNVLVQAIGLGLSGSLAEGNVVRRSFEVRAITPSGRGLGWAVGAVLSVLNRGPR